jgi:hypothetical protein
MITLEQVPWGRSDHLAMGPYANLTLSHLRKLAAEATSRLDASASGRFSTALTDAERDYLDLAAELYARGELPVMPPAWPIRRASRDSPEEQCGSGP